MATWGNTNQSTTSYQSTVANRYSGSVFTTPADMGTVTEIIAYIGGGVAGDECKLTIHKHSDLSLVYASGAIATDGSAAARTTGAISVALDPNTAYILGAVFETASDRFYKETGDANQSHVEDNSFATPTGLTSPTHGTILFQIYANYTPAGTAESANVSFSGVAGLSESPQATTLGALPVSTLVGLSLSGQAGTQGGISLVANPSLGNDDAATALATIVFGVTAGLESVPETEGQVVESLGFPVVAQLVFTGQAGAGGDSLFNGIAFIAPSGFAAAAAGLSQSINMALGLNRAQATESEISFNTNVGHVLSAAASVSDSVSIAAWSSLAIIGAALAGAGLPISSISGFSFTSVGGEVTIVTPLGRVFKIHTEVREYTVLEESRIFRVPAESRVYLVA